MTTIPARIDSPDADLFADSTYATGTLTTDHAASSYGLPVYVGPDGVAYGPADLPFGSRIEVAPQWTPEYATWQLACATAADNYESAPAPYTGEKYTAESLALIAGAKAAGYDIAMGEVPA